MATDKNMYELYFEWWLDDLQKVGLVKKYEREKKTYVVCDAIPIFFKQYYKRKDSIIKNFDLVSPITATPDYEVEFSEKLLNKLFVLIDKEKSIIVEDEELEVGNVYQNTLFHTTEKEFDFYNVIFDVKAGAKAASFNARLSSSRDFPIKRALLFQKDGIIINKVIPVGTANSLFAKTFMPKRYRYTDGGGSIRKIKGKFRTMEEWLLEKDIQI